ncbi:MAG: COQ9 family protein, partial [Geminicoccaceae bacterium]|nr:COQ9 family protein [Geminicoccaceae bacterium]
RRATLAAVLLSTTLFWLEDESEGCRATWAFLDRRIEDALNIGRFAGRLRGFVSWIPGLSGLGRPARE